MTAILVKNIYDSKKRKERKFMQRNERKSVVRLLSCIVLGLCLFNAMLFLNLNLSSSSSFTISDDQSLEVPVGSNDIQRALSINDSDGSCEWNDIKKPRNAPQDTDLFATLVAGFPGSGKRIAFMQLEGFSELRASDDYNITAGSYNTKFAFKKTNYPHHDGIWDWGKQMKQVILLVRNPRWALPSYHHLLYEIEYSDSWIWSYLRQYKAYTKRPPIEDWLAWRDARFDVEIKKWGWFIDFWMEGGIVRDMFSHDFTTLDHFERLKQPVMYAAPELIAAQSALVDVKPAFDTHCVEDLNCTVTAIASYERMLNETTGPSEIERFAATIDGKLSWDLINATARECVWHQMIVKGNTFANSYHDRDDEGPAEHEFNFTLPQLVQIQLELERVREKYSRGGWVNNTIAQSLVSYVDTYILSNTQEIGLMSNTISTS